MAFDQTKVVASRDYKVFLAPWASSNAVPANTILYGTAWGNPYVESGYVVGGLHFTTTVSRGEIRVDQSLEPVLRPATGRDTRMSTGLAELTAQHIKDATGQGTVDPHLSETAGTREWIDWDMDSTILTNYTTVGFDIGNLSDGEALRLIGWKGQVLGSPSIDITPDAPVVIPFEVALVPDSSTNPPRIMKLRDVEPVAA